MTPAARERARRGQGDQLRDEILSAAEAVLKESGRVEDITMRSVATRVGCTPAAIYLHFADRTELVFEVCLRHFRALERALVRATQGIDDPVDELQALGRAYVRFGLRHPEEYRILFMGHPDLMPDDMDVNEVLAVGGFQRVVDAAGRAIESGRLAGPEPFVVATHLWVSVHGLTSLLISKPWFPWGRRDELVDRHLAVLMDGLRASG